MQNKIKIGSDTYLVMTLLTQEDTAGLPEISITLDDEKGNVIQDIVLVRQAVIESVNSNEEPMLLEDVVQCYVYGDKYNENYTHNIVIPRYNED